MRGQEEPPHAADYAYCEDVLRRDDRDRWLASLFVPGALRPHFHALYAFSHEIARVREIVSEPLLGEIRFQWWRDALEGTGEAGATANPVGAALLDTVARFGLPKAPLLELIDARLRDLYGEPVDSSAALESYTEATCANLFRLAARILDHDDFALNPSKVMDVIDSKSLERDAGGKPESSFPHPALYEEVAADLGAASHAGIAYGLTGLLRALPWHCARGQVFVPAEILRAQGAEHDDLASGRATPVVLAALAQMRALARAHLETFHARLRGLPERSRAAFLPVCLCEPYLRLMEKPGYDPFKSVIELPQWRRQWILWRAARRWG